MGQKITVIPYSQAEVDEAAAYEKQVMDGAMIAHLEQRVIFQRAEIARLEAELAEWKSGKRRRPPAKKATTKKAAPKKP